MRKEYDRLIKRSTEIEKAICRVSKVPDNDCGVDYHFLRSIRPSREVTRAHASDARIVPDKEYSFKFHSPGLEPWILGLLKSVTTLGKVLDIGCGYSLWGFLIKTHLSNYEQLVGLDISKDKLLKLKNVNIYDELVVADASKLPFRKEAFDKIVSVEVLHVFIDCSVLDNIESITKDGGRIILTLPELPRGFSTGNLLDNGYDVYAYLLRGFFLVDLHKTEIIAMYDKPLMRILSLISKLVSKTGAFYSYFIASKVILTHVR